MTPRQFGMTHWYDPLSLARLAARAVIAMLFGAYADRRELVAAVNPVAGDPFDPTHDYSGATGEHGDFWFDFLADTGDGWASTRAVAQIASCGGIQPDGHGAPLPRGRLLVLGGDQVYPAASHRAYVERFIRPWDAAAHEVPRAPGAEAERADLGDLYAIPGNHDWYDGLVAFSHLFARRTHMAPHLASMARTGKIIARRQTRQVRSYFALKLPHGWWMWGTDSQLEGFIDQPQVDFFRHVASHWMDPGSKLILCVGQPSWTYVDPADPHQAFNSFSFLSRLATDALDERSMTKGHQLRLVLTGDAHHYSRYVEDEVHYVTAGGGGAFLHPTHHLPDHVAFEWEAPPPNQLAGHRRSAYPRHFALARDGRGRDGQAAIYPPARASRLQSLKLLAFGAYNPSFVLLYACFYGLLLWALDPFSVPHHPAATALWRRPESAGSFGDAWGQLIDATLSTPMVVLPLLVTGAIYISFADWRSRPKRRLLAGSLHALGHAAIFVAVSAAAQSSGGVAIDRWPGGAAVACAAALASASWFGLYLLLSLNLFGRHWNEAFSAIRVRHFKNMLRMRIDADGLTLYPLGLRHVPARDVPTDGLRTELIETPVRIS